ncbi:MAG: Dps family protein [Phycisphaerae bacterium]|jgi:starvation-inducible DNA-binding protein
MANANVEKGLNGLLADSTVLYEKLHAFHWYVAGPQFFQLHAKFEELYDRFAEVTDDLAERILTIGGKPVATLRGVLELAEIKEYTGTKSGPEMIAAIAADFEHLLDRSGKVIAAAEEADDRGTANLLDGLNDELQKTLWMLKAWQAA